MREAQAAGQQVVWFSSGSKAASTLRFRRLDVDRVVDRASASGPRTPTRRRSRTRSREAFANGDVDRVVVVYNAFVSALVQR